MKKQLQTYSLSVFAALYLNELHGEEKYNTEDYESVRNAQRNFNKNYRDKIEKEAAAKAAAKLIEMITARLNEDWGLME